MRQKERALRRFLFERMYRHFRVNRMTQKVRRVVRELFEQYNRAPNCLPQDWRDHAETLDPPARARLVGDYIAGMTDRYAIEEHRKLFDVTAAT
jgi:dGTPase